MGDILSKLQMVSEKIGVTETAHTIEEQVDLITESLDKIPASTDIATALDDLSEVAQNINNEEVYVDKTITANGEYLPAQDEATAYSKVTVNVPRSTNAFYIGRKEGEWPNYREGKEFAIIYPDSSGEVMWDTSSYSENTSYVLSMAPVKTIKADATRGLYFYFTPTDDFTGFYSSAGGGTSPLNPTGDTVVPGDGKCYCLRIKSMGAPELTKYDYDFSFEVVPSGT